MTRLVAGCLAALMVLCAAGSAAGATDAAAQRRREKWLARQKELKEQGILRMETMDATGDSSKRVDIVILSDGFEKDDLRDSYKGISDKIKQNLVKLAPFENFRNYINFHRLYIPSEKGEFALGSEVDRSRILLCDREKAISMALNAPDCDLMIVVSNTSGMARSTAWANLITLCSKGGVTGTTVHELGHAFGGLADEYVEPNASLRFGRGVPPMEPPQVNVTLEREPTLCKWHYWLKPQEGSHTVGCFEGALYVSKNVFRPERECVMRTGRSFCVVCMEQMVRTFFCYIDPIDEEDPPGVKQVLFSDEKMTFKVQALDYEVSTERKVTSKMNWRWYLDGVPVEPTQSKSAVSLYEFSAAAAGAGHHELVVSGDMIDSRVRRDMGLMSDSRFWLVDVLDYPRPKVTAPEQTNAQIGQAIKFQVKTEKLEAGGFKLRVEGLPANAKFDEAAGTFEWTPVDGEAGAYLAEFIAANDKREIRAKTVLIVGKPKENRTPQLVEAVDENGFEGQPMDLTVNAKDPDGDALLLDIKGLPPTAKFDRRTGTLTWTPGYTESKPYYVVMEATDGMKTASAKVILDVGNVPLRPDVTDELFAKMDNFDFCQALRSNHSDQRLKAMAHLKDTPVTFQATQVARLLRDYNDDVMREACAQLQVLMASEKKEEFERVFVLEIDDKMWQFVDSPEVLDLIAGVAEDAGKIEKPSAALKRSLATIQKELKRAESYNKMRDGARAKLGKDDDKKQE